MTPRVLFVGGERGSWAVRGVQMADALGARAVVDPERHDWDWAQIVVLVKRGIDKYGEMAKRSRLPIVWDVLDYWQQPEENQKPIAEHVQTVLELASRWNVGTLIGATQAMAEAIDGVYIPHHSRPKLKHSPVREKVQVVAYEGTPKYLGSWKKAIEEICAARGWRFVVNPESLSEADIVVALRDGQWDGEICREWKSGVKLVNAQAAGRPVIAQSSAAFREIHPVGSTIDCVEHLSNALDFWSNYERRLSAAERCRDRALAYTLSSVAHLYREHVLSLARRAA